MNQIVLIGHGKMGSALAKGWVKDNSKYIVKTAFEVVEHLNSFPEFLEKEIREVDLFLFSTELREVGFIPDNKAKSSLSEYARIDLPVRVLLRNQNKIITTKIAVMIVIPCVVLNAKPSRKPVSCLNSLTEIINLSPSAKR